MQLIRFECRQIVSAVQQVHTSKRACARKGMPSSLASILRGVLGATD
jgi:hypothetical protein